MAKPQELQQGIGTDSLIDAEISVTVEQDTQWNS